jgi:hypothetical protein
VNPKEERERITGTRKEGKGRREGEEKDNEHAHLPFELGHNAGRGPWRWHEGRQKHPLFSTEITFDVTH